MKRQQPMSNFSDKPTKEPGHELSQAPSSELARTAMEILGEAGYLSRATIDTLRCVCVELSCLQARDPLESMRACLAGLNSPGAKYYQKVLREAQNLDVSLDSARPARPPRRASKKTRASEATRRVALVF